MPIATLSTLSTAKFKGGAGLSDPGSGPASLVAALNLGIAKINEIIGGMVTLDTLTVGTAGGGTYYGSSDSWMEIDGTNPPTFSRIRMLDETTGLYVTWHTVGGVMAVV